MRYGKFKMGAGVAILATLALVLSVLVTTPASAKVDMPVSTYQEIPAVYSASFSNEAAPLSPPAGWMREVSQSGFVMDRRSDCATATVKAYNFPAGSDFTFASMGWTYAFHQPFSGTVTIDFTFMKSSEMSPMYGWDFQPPSLYGFNGADDLIQSCPPALSPLPKGQTAQPSTVTPAQFCAKFGKKAVRLKGKALKQARKFGKLTFKCMPVRKKRKKQPPSITSRTMSSGILRVSVMLRQ